MGAWSIKRNPDVDDEPADPGPPEPDEPLRPAAPAPADVKEAVGLCPEDRRAG